MDWQEAVRLNPNPRWAILCAALHPNHAYYREQVVARAQGKTLTNIVPLPMSPSQGQACGGCGGNSGPQKVARVGTPARPELGPGTDPTLPR